MATNPRKPAKPKSRNLRPEDFAQIPKAERLEALLGVIAADVRGEDTTPLASYFRNLSKRHRAKVH